jgi:type I restriction enzyme S subunit
MNDWKKVKLGDIATDVSYGYTESATTEKIGPKFLRITDIVPSQINWENVPYCNITDDDYKKYKLEIGDIVIARTGATTGYNKIIKDSVESVFASYLIRFKINKKIAIPFYIEYLLQSKQWYNYIESIISGSAQPGANAKLLSGFEISLPPLETQEKIAAILGCLDDKIEINNKINANLENQAQTIFKHYFVDFAPFKDGKFVESELGMIPEGWKVGYLGDILKLIKDVINVNKKGSLPYLPIDIIPMKSLAINGYKPTEEAQSSLISFLKDDIIIGAMRVYFHRVVISPFNGITRSTCFVLRPIKDVYREFALILCSQDSTINYANTTSKGTTMPYAVWNGALEKMPIIIPSDIIIKKFSEQTKGIIDKIRDSWKENQSLLNIRDTLLPKLMNGEINV